MPRIEWDETFSTYNEEIDAQHKKWFEMYNELHNAGRKGDPREITRVTQKTLDAVEEYARYHFNFEEEFMASIQYPGLEEHQRQHARFSLVIDEMKKDLREGRPGLHSQLITFMKKWIVDHIVRSDKKYAEFASSLK